MPPPDDRSSIWSIRYAARLVVSAMDELEAGMRDPDDWIVDSAIQHQLIVIGEAVKRLTPAFRHAHPEVPWADWAGLRDILVHRYDEVDLEIIRDVSLQDVHLLLAAIQHLIPEDE